MWRPKTCNATAFLVDQHRRLGARYGGAQLLDQPARALGRIDIAREQDEAQRIGIAEEGTLVCRKVGAGAAEDCCFHRQGIRISRDSSAEGNRRMPMAQGLFSDFPLDRATLPP